MSTVEFPKRFYFFESEYEDFWSCQVFFKKCDVKGIFQLIVTEELHFTTDRKKEHNYSH